MPRIRGIANLVQPPVAYGVPPPQFPWITYGTQLGTIATSGTTGTWTTTANVNPGQPISGPGLIPGSYVVGTVTATTMNILPAVGTGATGSTYTFGLFNPFNSGQFSGFSGSLLVSAPNYTGSSSGGVPVEVVGCLFEPPNVQVIASQSNYVIPPGDGIVSITAGATGTYQYQVQYASGTTGTATYWGTVNSYGGALNSFSYMSDGQNFRLMGTGQTAGTAVFLQWR